MKTVVVALVAPVLGLVAVPAAGDVLAPVALVVVKGAGKMDTADITHELC